MPAADAARGAAAAVAFLTRIPVARRVVLDGDDVARGAVLFPLVGAGIGAVVGGAAAGLVHVLPALVAAGVALALGAVLTGALHLDGLADTADALGARDRPLEAMRDHATGAFGTAALVLDLLVKAAALAALAPHGRTVVLDALAAGALGRAVPVVLAASLASVREDGAGAVFRVGRSRAAAACALGAALALAAGLPDALVLIAVAAAVAAALGTWYRRWLGGATGDMLGAAAELTETAVLVAAAALL
jgi:cobalamin 5'-phosphate synthase/cobalamin synthase